MNQAEKFWCRTGLGTEKSHGVTVQLGKKFSTYLQNKVFWEEF